MIAKDRTLAEEFSEFKIGEEIFYPNNFVSWSLRYFWLIALFPLVLLLLCDVVIAIAEKEAVLDWLRDDLTDAIFLSATFGLIIAAALIRRPFRSAPRKFIKLSENGSIQLKPEQTENSESFSEELRTNINSSWRWIVTIILVMIGALFSVYSFYERSFLTLIDSFEYYTTVGSIFLLLHLLARWVIGPIVIAFICGSFLWSLIVLGKAISKIPERFEVQIHASHPDRSGGFRRLGEICLDMAIPLLVFAFILVAWALYIVVVRDQVQDTVGVFSILGLVIIFVIASFVFFAPIWSIHDAMRLAKSHYQDKLGQELQGVEKRLENSVGQVDGEKLDRLLKEHETLQRLGDTARHYPVWPFDTAIFLALILPQVASIGSLILNWTVNAK
jgi:hypothetical protein